LTALPIDKPEPRRFFHAFPQGLDQRVEKNVSSRAAGSWGTGALVGGSYGQEGDPAFNFSQAASDLCRVPSASAHTTS